MKRTRKGQRGQAAILMALWLTGAFFALTVVGIDIGHLGTSATELQTVADIAASAGARNLLKGGSANTAKSDATSVVAKNKVDGQTFTMAAADVHVGTYISGEFIATGGIEQWSASSCGGGGKTIQSWSVGVSVSTVAGSHGSTIHRLVCVYNSAQRQYLLPIVKCNGNTLTSTVTGFATLVMDKAVDNKGIDWHTISMEIDDAPLAGGCAKCGSGKMALVK